MHWMGDNVSGVAAGRRLRTNLSKVPSSMRFPRASGVLLHVTSLPGPYGCGDLGEAARHFVDWLVAGGQSLWQVLPLGCIGLGNSPYMSSSAFAGNLLLIDLAELQQRGWLQPHDLEQAPDNSRAVDYETVIPWRMRRLALAADRFALLATPAEQADLEQFCQVQQAWLDDFALFMVLAEAAAGQDWCDWPQMLARRDPAALAQAAIRHAPRVAFWKFCQWCFFRQWNRLKAYASDRGVRMIGDLPIFIAQQSADVWAHTELFQLDAHGRPTVVAGVPPDSFSATGQRWGNPLYRWPSHAQDGYRWWVERFRHTCAMVDIVRVDHFRGFESCWEIAADEPTAERGRWVQAPGDALFAAATQALGHLPIIAEDLGLITPEVEHLRRQHQFPGMRVLQFAWGPEAVGEPRFLPHNHQPDSVVYGGTHDNDTTLGWWQSAPEEIRHQLREYLACDGMDVGWDLIRTACASVADMAVHTMQDVLRLSGEHRMNRPGVGTGNWSWRFSWDQVRPGDAQRLRRMAELYGRLPASVEYK